MRRQRQWRRLKRRLTCDVEVDGGRYVGVVLDLSPGGFFVQTGARAPVGSTVGVRLRQDEGGDVLIQARVVNRRTAQGHLARVVKPGLGCSITRSGRDYAALLGQLA